MTVTNTPISAHSEGTPTPKAALEPLTITISTATLPTLFDLGYVRGWQHGHYAARQLYRMLDDGGR
jgi:hypothetical protein